MKLFISSVSAVLLFLFAIYASTSWVKVPSGNVGVKVYLLGSSKGVDSEELPVGRYWVGWNEELYLFPTFTQNVDWKSQDELGDQSIYFQTSEGMKVSADVGAAYHIDPAKVNLTFQKYRKGVSEISNQVLFGVIRDALVREGGKHPIEDIYGSGKSQLLIDAQKIAGDYLEQYGIIIERLSWLSDIRVPESVQNALNAKMEATQKAQQRQNEVAQAKAEADKKVEQARGDADSITLIAKAQSDANVLMSKSLTKELVQYKTIEKWDGILPRMTGNGVVPLIQIPSEEIKPNAQ